MDSSFVIHNLSDQSKDSLSLWCFPGWSRMFKRAPNQSFVLGCIHPGQPSSASMAGAEGCELANEAADFPDLALITATGCPSSSSAKGHKIS